VTNKLALVVAVVLGVLSILGVRFYVEKIKVSYDTKSQLVPVPVARRDLKFGDTIQSGDVDMGQIPRAVLDALGDSYYLEANKFEGAKIVVPLVKQGQVFQTYHFRVSSGIGKKMQIPVDCRAFTIAVSPTTGVGGMLRPGDKVDMLVSQAFKDPAGTLPGTSRELKITYTFLQAIEVLAVDQITDPDSAVFEYNTVTLKLKVEDANRTQYMIDAGGSYRLVKRSDDATPSSSSNPVFAESEFARIQDQINEELRKTLQKRVNQGNQPPR